MLTWAQMSFEERIQYAPSIACFLLTRRANNRATGSGRAMANAIFYRKCHLRRIIDARQQLGLPAIIPAGYGDVGTWFGIDAYDKTPRLFPATNEPGAMTACHLAVLTELCK